MSNIKPVAWMREGWGSDCGPYTELYLDEEMTWRDFNGWTPLYRLTPAQLATLEQADTRPIDMVLHCPACGLQHVDAPDHRTPDWNNPPHRSHLCHGCGHIWRPADVPTNGVQAVQTKGKADSPIAAPKPDTEAALRIEVTLDDSDTPIPIEVRGTSAMLARLQAFHKGRVREVQALTEERDALHSSLLVANLNCETIAAERDALRAENERLLAANRDCMLHYEDARADAERLREALRELVSACNHDSANRFEAALNAARAAQGEKP